MTRKEPDSRFVELDTGLRYHVLEWNPEAAHTVILIHGFLDSSWGWQGVVDAGLSARDLHIVAADMRGHGDSDRVGAGGYYHFLDYLADLRSLARAITHDRLSLVGHSMGGTVAGYYAGCFPDAVHRLALLEGMGPPENDTPLPERVVHWIAGWTKARERDTRGYANLDEAARRLMARDSQLDFGLARELARRQTRENPDKTLAFKHDPQHLTTGPYPFRVASALEFWRRITCPVLLLEGETSYMRYSEEDTARRLGSLRDQRRRTIENAGHMMQRHQPAAVAEALAEFLCP